MPAAATITTNAIIQRDASPVGVLVAPGVAVTGADVAVAVAEAVADALAEGVTEGDALAEGEGEGVFVISRSFTSLRSSAKASIKVVLFALFAEMVR